MQRKDFLYSLIGAPALIWSTTDRPARTIVEWAANENSRFARRAAGAGRKIEPKL
jgi:hypothetical protein